MCAAETYTILIVFGYPYINILVPKTIEIIWICAAHNFFIVL